VRRIVTWGLFIPLFALVLGVIWFPWGFGVLLLYPLQWARLTVREARKRPLGISSVYALSLVIDKFAQLVGVWTYIVRRARGRGGRIIEYKSSGARGGAGEASS